MNQDKWLIFLATIVMFTIILTSLFGCGEEDIENTQVERVSMKISTFMYGEHRFLLYYENSASMQHDPSCPYCVKQQELRDNVARKTLDELIKLNRKLDSMNLRDSVRNDKLDEMLDRLY